MCSFIGKAKEITSSIITIKQFPIKWKLFKYYINIAFIYFLYIYIKYSLYIGFSTKRPEFEYRKSKHLDARDTQHTNCTEKTASGLF